MRISDWSSDVCSSDLVEGMARFLRRFWREVQQHVAQPDHPEVDATALDAGQKALRRQLHGTIQKVGDAYGRRHSFNTAIAALMELLNHVAKSDSSEEHRVGKEVCRRGRSRWSPKH